MRILMLGWEFPPFIAGGLGVACFGLTKALDKLGHHVVFVLPKPIDRSRASHVKLLGPYALTNTAGSPGFGGLPASNRSDMPSPYGFEHATFHALPATFNHPYPGSELPLGSTRLAGVDAVEGEQAEVDPLASIGGVPGLPKTSAPAGSSTRGFFSGAGATGAGTGYGNDLVGDAERYARLCVALAKREQFDVIHAHDWLTFPAAAAVARVTGKPLVVHVHSTEFDRSGSNVNQRVYDIERMGMHAASRVICVSMLTKNLCVRRYGVPEDRIDVVYNGLDREAHQPPTGAKIEVNDKIVLFLGRITMQKGPEYFIAAAQRVLEKVPDAKFVLAGSGDMALRMIDLAASLGIGSRVLFTGFLRGADIERVFSMADCYVMPSVSEPFGIAALEALSHDVPVILSKTSGASEVLQHVLKVDFWDIDEMANKIVAVLRHPPLSSTLRQHGQMELHRLTWETAAKSTEASYERAIAGVGSAGATQAG